MMNNVDDTADRDAPDMTRSADPPHPSGGDSASDQTEQDQIWMKGYGVGLSTGMFIGGLVSWLGKKGFGPWARS